MKQTLQVVPSVVTYLDPKIQARDVFERAIEGLARLRISLGHEMSTIRTDQNTVRRCQQWIEATYGVSGPWAWERHMGEAWIAERRLGPESIAVQSARIYQGAIRKFFEFLCDPNYPALPEIQRLYGATPQSIFDEFNSIKHSKDSSAKTTERYPLPRKVLQQIFDYLDDRTDRARGKSIVPAARDSAMFKAYYAFGTRRDELRLAEVHDLSYNASMPQYRDVGSILIRFGKGTNSGSGPRTRVVRTVPQFEWIVDVMEQYLIDIRPRLVTSSAALFPSERDRAFSPTHIDDRWADIRRELGLDENYKLHCVRHSFMTHLLEAGYPAKFIQMQAGHFHLGSMTDYTNKIGDEFCNTVLRNAQKAAFAPRAFDEAATMLHQVDSDQLIDENV